MLKLVIFDLDGTLLNTLDDLADSCNYILQKNGYPTHPTDAYKYFVGDGIRKLIERALPLEVKQNTAKVEICLSEFLDYYALHKMDKTAPYEGMMQTLEQLQQRNIAIAVASNKVHHEVEPLLQFYFPSISFIKAVGQKKGVPTKPDPTMVLEILDETKISPKATIYVGDTSVDMQTGKNAGLYTIGALWGFRTAKELTENGADKLIYHPEEILAIIQ